MINLARPTCGVRIFNRHDPRARCTRNVCATHEFYCWQHARMSRGFSGNRKIPPKKNQLS